MSSSKSSKISYAPPIIISPPRNHETTLIILHGRGSTAEKFADPLLAHVVSSGWQAADVPSDTISEPQKCFQDYFPNTKLMFPTAPLRRAVVFKRSLIYQWFDNWSLTQPELKQELQIPGLRETSSYIHELLRQEIESVGAKNVVVVGLSQGCAVSLVSMLLWEGEAFGALVGMCGYLPFRKGMHDYAEDTSYADMDALAHSEDDSEDMFERDEQDPSRGGSKMEMAIDWLREELQTEEQSDNARVCSAQSIPIFMGHGKEDEKVSFEFGKLAAGFLQSMDFDVHWREYGGLGHWYSDEMLRDIIQFLGNLEGWKICLE